MSSRIGIVFSSLFFAAVAMAQSSGTPSSGTPAAAEGASTPTPAAAEASAPATSTDAATAESAPVGAAPPVDGAAPTADGAAPAAAPSTDELNTGEQEYDLQVKELEGKVNDLKEQIFRSKAKLTLLTQAVTEGGLGQGARVLIVHKNEMGGNFVLTEVNYFLDGAPLWQELDESGKKLTEKRKYIVWEGNIVEGSHTLSVQMTYRGNGSGVFSYIQGYTFNLKDTHTFSAEPGKMVVIETAGFEQGNFTTELTERPALRFDTKLKVNEKQSAQQQ